MISRFFRRRVNVLHTMGANLDAASLKFVRRARWWLPFGALFILVIAATEDGWFEILFFGFFGLLTLCYAWPMMFILLRGYEMRDQIAARDAYTFDAERLSSGVAYGCGLVPFVGAIEHYWPW